MMRGKVVELDEHSGLGVVEPDDGGRLGFHCTQIADGSRTIKVGTKVRFDVIPGNGGVWEAGALEPVG
ncbi:MAG: cold shock domain-containing protein [Acidimicrobiia bacterium]